MTLIPYGVTEADFHSALDKFRAIVGRNWVFTEAQDIGTYRDSYSPVWGEPEERLASAAVAPANVDEVQALVQIANTYKIPLYPISTGKNLGYGGAAPNFSGSVVVDLKRMNRILEVDVTRSVALVEPGVSYFDLYNYIQENNLPLWIDCPDPGWGSVLGNAIDRGFGYTGQAYRDHNAAQCGLEVVLPSGELMRTGMGALPNSKAWTDFRPGFGPDVAGLFSQGNFGIVTKMGIHLMPRPQALSAGTVAVSRYQDIVPLVEAVNYLEVTGTCDGMTWITSPVQGTLGAPPDPEITRVIGTPNGPSDADLERIAKGRPFWHARVLSYGGRAVAKAKWEYAKEVFREKLPNCQFIDESTYELPLSPDEIENLGEGFDSERKPTFGIPGLSVFALGARSPVFPKPTDGHIWFSPVIPRSGQALMKAQNVFCRAVADRGAYVGFNAPLPQAFGPRYFMMIFPVFISKTDADANRAGIDLLKYLIEVAAENGWGEFRAAPVLQDFISDLYSFNDHSLRRFTESLKDAADPNGIMAAGRYGIWPKHLREARRLKP